MCQFLNKAFCPPWVASWDEEQGADASSVPFRWSLSAGAPVSPAAKEPAGHRGGGCAVCAPLVALLMEGQAGGLWLEGAVDVHSTCATLSCGFFPHFPSLRVQHSPAAVPSHHCLLLHFENPPPEGGGCWNFVSEGNSSGNGSNVK